MAISRHVLGIDLFRPIACFLWLFVVEFIKFSIRRFGMLKMFRKGLGAIGFLAILVFMTDWVVNQPMLQVKTMNVNVICLGMIFLFMYMVSSGGIFLSMFTNTKIDRVANWASLLCLLVILSIYSRSLVETSNTLFSTCARIGFLVVVPLIAMIDAFTKPRT